jgi:hypothetical protein
VNILILDDEEYRHDAFRKRFAGHDVWHTFTVAQFRHVYHSADHVWDLVHLDHDLGTKETGMNAVDYMVEFRDERRPVHVVVHSWNASAGPLMFSVLHRHGFNVRYQPFEVSK